MGSMTNISFNSDQKRGQPKNSGQWVAEDNSFPEAILEDTASVELRGEIELDEVGSAVAAEEIVAGIKNSKQRFELTFVDYDDRANPELINDVLAGNYEGVDKKLDAAFDDQRYDFTLSEAKTLCEERGVDYDALDWDDQNEVRNAIQEMDVSTPLNALLRNTPAQLMRAPIGGNMYAEMAARGSHNLAYYDDANWEAQQAGRINLLLDVLSDAGVNRDGEGVREAVETVVVEGPGNWHEGVRFDVIWQGDVEEAASAPLQPSEAPNSYGKSLTFTNANIVLLDTVNGSGMDAELPGDITVAVTPGGPARLDSQRGSGSGGYGWDDTAGVVHSAYKPGNVKADWLVTDANA